MMKFYGCLCCIMNFGKVYKRVEILYSNADTLAERYNRLLKDYPEEEGYDVSIIRINTYEGSD